MILRFTVPGPPVPKQRPRVVRTKTGVRTFTPPETERYERQVRAAAELELNVSGARKSWPFDARYSVTATCCFPDARRRDLDNAAKSCLDALNGCLWNDDSQVDELHAHRRIDRECPRVDVVVEVIA